MNDTAISYAKISDEPTTVNAQTAGGLKCAAVDTTSPTRQSDSRTPIRWFIQCIDV